MPTETDNLYIRRANPTNDFFSGLFAGANQIVDAVNIKNQHNDLIKEYNKTRDYLHSIYDANNKATNDIINLVKTPTGTMGQQQSATDTNIVSNPASVDDISSSISSAKFNPQDVYANLVDKALKMSANYGETAQPYINALQGLYNNYFGRETPKPEYREIDGKLYLIDPNNPSNPKLIIDKAPKVEKKKYTPAEVYSMGMDEILAMPDGNDFIDKNFNALSPETQKALQEKYPYLIPEEKTSRRTGYRGSGREAPMTNAETDATSTAKDLRELKGHYNTMTPEEKKAYDEEAVRLANELGISTEAELNQFLEDAYNSDRGSIRKKIKEYKERDQEFGNTIQNFNLKDIEDDLYSINTDTSVNPNGLDDFWNMVDRATEWVNEYAKSLSNADADKLFKAFDELVRRVKFSKYINNTQPRYIAP